MKDGFAGMFSPANSQLSGKQINVRSARPEKVLLEILRAAANGSSPA
jgi:hypothetical protein